MATTYEFNYWCNEWLDYKKNSIKESTYVKYKNSLNIHIIPVFGGKDIRLIDTYELQDFAGAKLDACNNKCLSNVSVSQLISIIKNIFIYAEEFGVYSNCKYQLLKVRKSANKKIRVLNLIEQRSLTDILIDDIDEYKLGVLISLYTGLRIGELCSLKWSDIDFDEHLIQISRTVQRVQEKNGKGTHILIAEPKTTSSFRQIPIPDFLFQYLLDFKKDSKTYVIVNNKNRLVEPRVMQYRFKKYLKSANINDANFHCLRHTFATRCVEAGVEIKVLSEVLGHSSVSITLDRYVHNSMDYKKSNISKFNNYLLDFSQN